MSVIAPEQNKTIENKVTYMNATLVLNIYYYTVSENHP